MSIVSNNRARPLGLHAPPDRDEQLLLAAFRNLDDRGQMKLLAAAGFLLDAGSPDDFLVVHRTRGVLS